MRSLRPLVDALLGLARPYTSSMTTHIRPARELAKPSPLEARFARTVVRQNKIVAFFEVLADMPGHAIERLLLKYPEFRAMASEMEEGIRAAGFGEEFDREIERLSREESEGDSNGR
jgi:hypothetical protein